MNTRSITKLNLLPVVCFLACVCVAGCATNRRSEVSNTRSGSSATVAEDSGSTEKAKTPFELQRADPDQAVRDYVGKTYPGATIKGVSNTYNGGGGDLVAVDLERAGKSSVVPVLVHFFFAEDGQRTYYKAGPVRSDLLPRSLTD